LSDEEGQRASRFRFEQHRNRYIVGRATLRQILGAYLNNPPEKFDFEYGNHGKPTLASRNGAQTLEFNLAHSDALALIAVSQAGPVGVDVEQVRPLKDADELVKRFFSPRENSAFQKLSSEQKPQAFFNLWTRKEAWLKATGDGIAHHLNRVEVSFLPGEPAQLLSLPDNLGSETNWSLRELNPAPGFTAAVALACANPEVNCFSWNSSREPA
jgi:4'-phosphopantetheinyl transferase